MSLGLRAALCCFHLLLYPTCKLTSWRTDAHNHAARTTPPTHTHTFTCTRTTHNTPPHLTRSTAGSVLGYASSLLYLGSRVSQIYKNWSRHSVEGLAMSMFLFAILANSCYGASILLRTYTWAQLASSLPWLIGSLGTVALDATIFLQSRLLGDGGAKKRESDEEESLLGEEDKEAARLPHAHHSHRVH